MAGIVCSEMDGLKTQRRHAARTRDMVRLQEQLDSLQSQIFIQEDLIHRLLLRDTSYWEKIDDENVVWEVVEEEMAWSDTASESTRAQSDDAEPIIATTAIEDDDVMLQKIKDCVEIPVSTQAQSMVQNCDVVSEIVTCCRSRLAKLNFALGNVLVTQMDAFLTGLSGCRSGYQECVDIEQQVTLHQQHKLKFQECVDDEQQVHQQHRLDKVQKSPNFNHQHKIVSRVMAPKKKKKRKN